ncbi:hypothetical protein TNCV_283411 [Trichonephila clavipes]|uniref:Uncharacterized protein n=1 Tax=Trichonephila clavipes TaxID=2585209 RepID=A0A8X6SIV2_TRICX|nr:hypothetical protein TNCV_283411 [Trichonephila clavipes]
MEFLELAPKRKEPFVSAEFSQFSFGSLNFLGVSGTSEITVSPTSYRCECNILNIFHGSFHINEISLEFFSPLSSNWQQVPDTASWAASNLKYLSFNCTCSNENLL